MGDNPYRQHPAPDATAGSSSGMGSAQARKRVGSGTHLLRQGVCCAAAMVIALGLAVGAAPAEPVADAPVVFTDVTAVAGIDFVETVGDNRMTNIVESTGAGCGFVDYDGDGWLDIYLVSGCWTQGLSDPGLDAERRGFGIAETTTSWASSTDPKLRMNRSGVLCL